ncbi:MAG: glycosyltransferase [Actinomycetales bacterium]
MSRILVDATAVPADRAGVGRYLDNVVAQLDLLGAELLIAAQRRDLSVWAELAPGARVIATPPAIAKRPTRLAWEQSGLAALAAKSRADVLFSPHYTTAYAAPLPKVITLHDATFFSDPHVHEPVKARFFRAATRSALRLAHTCITPSQATKDEVLRWAGPAVAAVEVVPLGVDLSVFTPAKAEEIDRFCQVHGLRPGNYIAFLGTLEPRKNPVGLVRGWVRAFEAEDDPPPLVLAGMKGWDASLDSELARVPPHLRVFRTGYLPTEDLPTYLSGAGIVAYPSLGEGFGLPVAEAMACGAPVLTTKRLSLPEVGGKAVAYTEPDPEAIATALYDLWAQPARRAELGAAGLDRARTHFSWRRAGEAHLALLERAANTRRQGLPATGRVTGDSDTEHPPADVAVLMATYNGAAYLDAQLDSILAQEGASVRVICCDDDSTDDTPRLLTERAAADPRVSVLRTPDKAGGAAANFYRLIRHAQVRPGELVAFSDQDDVWLAGKLARQIAVLSRGMAGVSSDVTAFDPDGRRTLIRKSFPQKQFDYLFESPGPGSTFVLTPELFELVRCVLTNEGSSVVRPQDMTYHDWLIYGVCRARGWRWQILDTPTLDYRQHAGNAMGANHGLRQKLARARLVANSWHREQAQLMCDVALDVAADQLRPGLTRMRELLHDESAQGRAQLAAHASQLRRRRRDCLVLGAAIGLGLW